VVNAVEAKKPEPVPLQSCWGEGRECPADHDLARADVLGYRKRFPACGASGYGGAHGEHRRVLTRALLRAGTPGSLLDLPGHLAAPRERHTLCGAQDPAHRRLRPTPRHRHRLRPAPLQLPRRVSGTQVTLPSLLQLFLVVFLYI
jgi:hypothetical protein